MRGTVRAVDHISFKLGKGESMGLVGESGCGKSSTALAIMKLLPRNIERHEGKVILDGKNIMTLDENELRLGIRWKRISMVFQGSMNSLNPVLTVGFQTAEPLIVHQNMKKREAINRAKEFFKLVGLPPDFTERYPWMHKMGVKKWLIRSWGKHLS